MIDSANDNRADYRRKALGAAITSNKVLQAALPKQVSYDEASDRLRDKETGRYVSADQISNQYISSKAATQISNSLTGLEYQFNRMLAYTDNIATIKRAELDAGRDARREALFEARQGTANTELAGASQGETDKRGIVEALRGLSDSLSNNNRSLINKTLGTAVTLLGILGLADLFSAATSEEERAPEEARNVRRQVTAEEREDVTPEARRRGSPREQPTQQFPSVPTDIAVILETIRERESRGNYGIHDTIRGSSASGAYQFIDSTWQSKAREYGIDISRYGPRAYMAPPEVQDEVARRYVEEILANVNGDVSMVPVVWLTGNYQGAMSAAGAAINPSVQEYRRNWMEAYNRNLGAAGYNRNTSSPTNIFDVTRSVSQRDIQDWYSIPRTFTGEGGRRGVITRRQREGGIRISSLFGDRIHPVTGRRSPHHGYDIAAPRGTQVFPVAYGRVSFAGQQNGYGNVVEITHGVNENGAYISTFYAHLNSINVRVGNSVNDNEVIGTVGNTGTSTGNHLHFEMRVNGQAQAISGYRSLPARVLGTPGGPVPGLTPNRATVPNRSIVNPDINPLTDIPRQFGDASGVMSSSITLPGLQNHYA